MSGPVPNVTCIFPFKTVSLNKLETYSTCVRGGDYNDWKYWCPIKIDTSGVYEYSPDDTNTWGNCASDCQTVDTCLIVVRNYATNNYKVVLRCNDYEWLREWDKIYEGKDDWFKLRHYWSGKVLQLSPDGEHLSVSYNLEPCHGQKPCLR